MKLFTLNSEGVIDFSLSYVDNDLAIVAGSIDWKVCFGKIKNVNNVSEIQCNSFDAYINFSQRRNQSLTYKGDVYFTLKYNPNSNQQGFIFVSNLQPQEPNTKIHYTFYGDVVQLGYGVSAAAPELCTSINPIYYVKNNNSVIKIDIIDTVSKKVLDTMYVDFRSGEPEFAEKKDVSKFIKGLMESKLKTSLNR